VLSLAGKLALQGCVYSPLLNPLYKGVYLILTGNPSDLPNTYCWGGRMNSLTQQTVHAHMQRLILAVASGFLGLDIGNIGSDMASFTIIWEQQNEGYTRRCMKTLEEDNLDCQSSLQRRLPISLLCKSNVITRIPSIHEIHSTT